MTTPEAREALTEALATVDPWAADPTFTEAVVRILAALHDAGYALTPLAPEVPPRRDGLREQLANLDRLADGPAHRRDLLRDWARFHAEELANTVSPPPGPPSHPTPGTVPRWLTLIGWNGRSVRATCSSTTAASRTARAWTAPPLVRWPRSSRWPMSAPALPPRKAASR